MLTAPHQDLVIRLPHVLQSGLQRLPALHPSAPVIDQPLFLREFLANLEMRLSVASIAPLVLLTCALIVAWQLRPALAQSTADDPYQADVRLKLDTETAFLSKQGYERVGVPDVKPVMKQGAQSVEVSLRAGETYAVIAACDQDCTHVQLSLLDKGGTLLVKSPEIAPVVIVNGSPPTTGAYRLELSVPGCSSKACSGGIAVVRQKSTSAVVAPSKSEDVARRVQEELKRVGCYAGEVDGLWGTNSTEAIRFLNRNLARTIEAATPTSETLNQLTALSVSNCGCEAGKIVRDGQCVAKSTRRTGDQAVNQQKTGNGSDGSCFNKCIARIRWAPTCAARCAQ